MDQNIIFNYVMFWRSAALLLHLLSGSDHEN